MSFYGHFDPDGLPIALFDMRVCDYNLPDGAVEITRQQWDAFLNNQGLRRWQDGHVVPYSSPVASDPQPGPVILFPADLWRRATDEEAEQIEAAMNGQSARLRNLFRTAQTYQSDDSLWPVLEGAAVQLFGEERAAELLAASA